MANHQKTKLFRIVQNLEECDGAFTPSVDDCREVFRSINRAVFNNELKEPEFHLVGSKKYWGECIGDENDVTKCTIKINKKFIDKRIFIFTMAHEMVHQWEWLTYENMTHGPTFFIWRKELAKFGIKLSRRFPNKNHRF